TPVATLAAILLCVVIGVRRFRFNRIDFDWYILLTPIVLYTAFAMAVRVHIGIRHLLPVYPFLFIAVGAGLARMDWRYKKPALLTVMSLLIVESLSIYPHYLAFFNAAFGGPRNGPRYLLDSN